MQALAKADEIESQIEDKGPWDGAALEWGYQERFTIKWTHAERHSWIGRELVRKLSNELGHLVRLNVYITPGLSQGFASHFDTDDVYILQLQGSKEWTVFSEPPINLPIQDWGEKQLRAIRGQLGRPAIKALLQQGDALYIPRGWVHHANAPTQEGSTHVTVGVMQSYFVDLVYDGLMLLRDELDLLGPVTQFSGSILELLADAAQSSAVLRAAPPHGWLKHQTLPTGWATAVGRAFSQPGWDPLLGSPAQAHNLLVESTDLQRRLLRHRRQLFQEPQLLYGALQHQYRAVTQYTLNKYRRASVRLPDPTHEL